MSKATDQEMPSPAELFRVAQQALERQDAARFTKREQFATAALQGLLAAGRGALHSPKDAAKLSASAYVYADAMLAAEPRAADAPAD